jgi:hypothetical protein
MRVSISVALFVSLYINASLGYIPSGNKLRNGQNLQRLNTALPLPSQIFETAAKSTLFGQGSKALYPLIDTVRRVSMSWQALIMMTAALITRFQSKIKRTVAKAANKMEAGWTQRGTNGSLRRTVEIWWFAISFIFKVVSV